MSLWRFCLIIAEGASRFDSLAAEERQELREARQRLASLITSNEYAAEPAADLTSSTQFVSRDSPSDPHNMRDAV